MPRPSHPAATTVAEFVRSSARRHGSRAAIVFGADRLDYESLDRESRVLARGLMAMGVGKGARVGLFLADGPNWLRAWAALGRIGAIAVPLSTFAKDAELARAIRHPDVVAVLFDRTIAGTDTVARFEQALPGLRDQPAPSVRLPAAPSLRWLACFDDAAPPWASTRAHLDALAATIDEALLTAAENDVHPDEPALMIYTSGSTSDPKGVVHSHRTVFAKTADVGRHLCFEADERTYSPLPFFWVGGLVNNLLPALANGGTVYCLDRFDATLVLELVETERLTRVQAYPQHAAALADHPLLAQCDRSSMRWGPPALLTRPLPVPPGGLYTSLGMTETFGPYSWGSLAGEPSTMATYVPVDELEQGYDVKIVDEHGAVLGDGEQGEILVRGPTLMLGLHKQAGHDVFDRDGFYRTGDLGVRRDGRIYFEGRRGDMIKRGGANVAPREVEALLVEADGVEQAFVVGIPDDRRGQLVAAAVVAREGARLDPTALRAWVRERLSAFKVPDVITVMAREEIPRTDSQKVALDVLARQLSDRHRA